MRQNHKLKRNIFAKYKEIKFNSFKYRAHYHGHKFPLTEKKRTAVRVSMHDKKLQYLRKIRHKVNININNMKGDHAKYCGHDSSLFRVQI
jgi:hypothetical protein